MRRLSLRSVKRRVAADTLTFALVLVGALLALSCRQLESCGSEVPVCDLSMDERSGSVSQAAVYLDLSTTMKGYIPQPDQRLSSSALQYLLRTSLVDSFSSVGLGAPKLVGFGEDPETLEDVPLSAFAIKVDDVSPRDRYTAGDTNIIAALMDASKVASQLSVIITDNAQDMTDAGFAKRTFIRTVVDELYGQGFGVWLIGFMNDYDGWYRSVLPVGTESGRSFLLNDPRPAYLWVISRDHVQGRRLVAALEQDLEDYLENHPTSTDRPEEPLHVVEFAPLRPPQVLTKPPECPDFGAAAENGGRYAECLDSRAWPVQWNGTAVISGCLGFVFRSPVEHSVVLQPQILLPSDRSNGQRWNLPAATWRLETHLRAAETEVAWSASAPTWAKIEPRPNSSGVPGEGVSESSSQALTLRLDGNSLSALPANLRRLHLTYFIHAEVDKIPKDYWLRSWSAPSDTRKDQIEGKTVFLEDVALGVLSETAGKRRKAGCVHLTLVKD